MQEHEQQRELLVLHIIHQQLQGQDPGQLHPHHHHLVQDPFLPFLARTSIPCSEGPCQCNPWDFKPSSSSSVCIEDIFDTTKHCYVALESRCPDKQPSKKFPSLAWSKAACSQSRTQGEPEEPKDQQGTWSFSSTFQECRDYCRNSERFTFYNSLLFSLVRCKDVLINYDNNANVCTLITR